jgi:hypothetical protein
MAKRPCNICDKIEELVFDSDSEEKFTSDDSENECKNKLSQDTDLRIPKSEECHDRRREGILRIIHCSLFWIG